MCVVIVYTDMILIFAFQNDYGRGIQLLLAISATTDFVWDEHNTQADIILEEEGLLARCTAGCSKKHNAIAQKPLPAIGVVEINIECAGTSIGVYDAVGFVEESFENTQIMGQGLNSWCIQMASSERGAMFNGVVRRFDPGMSWSKC